MFFMGHYYKPILNGKKNRKSETLGFFNYHFNTEVKLTEHTYVGNNLKL